MTKSIKTSEGTAKPGTCEALGRVSAHTHTKRELQLYKTWSAHTVQHSAAHNSAFVMDRQGVPKEAVALVLLHTLEQSITNLISTPNTEQDRKTDSYYFPTTKDHHNSWFTHSKALSKIQRCIIEKKSRRMLFFWTILPLTLSQGTQSPVLDCCLQGWIDGVKSRGEWKAKKKSQHALLRSTEVKATMTCGKKGKSRKEQQNNGWSDRERK